MKNGKTVSAKSMKPSKLTRHLI